MTLMMLIILQIDGVIKALFLFFRTMCRTSECVKAESEGAVKGGCDDDDNNIMMMV